MRPNPIRRQGHEMQRQARLVSQTPADNSPPGNDAAHAGDAARIDPATGNPQYFGLFDITPLNDGPTGGFLLS